MRHHRRPAPALLGLLVIAASVAACSSASAGWTYFPAPPPTPVPSTDASVSAAPSGAPSGSVEPSGSAPAPSGSGGGGPTVTITAQNIQFTTPNVTAPSTGFTLAFDNEDAGTPHDVQIKDANGAKVAETEIFPGVATKTIQLGPLAAGTYPFACTVHSNMTGTLTVQ
jgi:plastocyanin